MFTKTELTEARTFARQGIVGIARANQSGIPGAVNPPTVFLTGTHPYTVAFRRIIGAHRNLSLVEGNSSIEVRIPFSAQLTQDVCRQPVPQSVRDLEIVVMGAFLHEVAHKRHEFADPASYKAAVAQRRTFEAKLLLRSVSARDWLDGYYNSPEDLEAHAVQLAVEVFFVNGAGLSQGAFEAAAAGVKLYGRLAGIDRLDLDGPSDTDITQWRQDWITMAWSEYSAW